MGVFGRETPGAAFLQEEALFTFAPLGHSLGENGLAWRTLGHPQWRKRDGGEFGTRKALPISPVLNAFCGKPERLPNFSGSSEVLL
jgi:hypothetical protein